MKRLLTGLLLAPLWAPLCAAVIATFFWFPPNFIDDVDHGTWIGMAAAVGTVFGYAAILAIGLPTHIILRRSGHRSVWAYLTTWFTLAVIVWLVGFIASFAWNGLIFSFAYLAETIVHRLYVPIFFGIVWAVVGATFWAIVRPDREPLSQMTYAKGQ